MNASTSSRCRGRRAPDRPRRRPRPPRPPRSSLRRPPRLLARELPCSVEERREPVESGDAPGRPERAEEQGFPAGSRKNAPAPPAVRGAGAHLRLESSALPRCRAARRTEERRPSGDAPPEASSIASIAPGPSTVSSRARRCAGERRSPDRREKASRNSAPNRKRPDGSRWTPSR